MSKVLNFSKKAISSIKRIQPIKKGNSKYLMELMNIKSELLMNGFWMREFANFNITSSDTIIMTAGGEENGDTFMIGAIDGSWGLIYDSKELLSYLIEDLILVIKLDKQIFIDTL